MTNSPNERAILAAEALKFVPPLIRKSLFNEKNFIEKYSLKTEVMITLEGSDVSVQRSDLFDAVRTVLTSNSLVKLNDAEDRTWNLTNNAREGELPNFALSSDQQQLMLPDFSVLSGDASIRIRSLEKSASDVNLPLSAQEKWRSILLERALENDEVYIFQSDICDTPVHVERTIQNEIMVNKITVSSLVPYSRRYFERLVGAYDGSDSIQDYAAGTGSQVFKELLEWRPYDGFLFSLLLSSHSALTTEIKADHLDPKDLEKAFDYLEKHGDMLSRIGALEFGLRILPDRPEVEPFLLRLVYRIRDDDMEDATSEFKLFSALFVLVDGELAKTRLLADKPSFYRRLAALAQAALIHRQLVQSEIDYDHFCKWACSNRGEYFYMQSLTDMRAEPRWNPDFATASQLQADFLGRIMIAGNNSQANLGKGELRDTVLSDGERSLIKRYKFLHPFFPGPLEGAEDSPSVLPDDFARIIEEQLDSDKVEPASFIALVNSAMIFRIASDHSELAAEALRLSNYTLANLKDKSQLLGLLNGLATVAAVSRNPGLADELRILVRRYRRHSQYGLTVEEALKICLVASAAMKELTEWRRFAGDWLTEIAFDDLKENEGAVFHSHLLILLHSVPELWVSCARADAALRAWCFR